MTSSNSDHKPKLDISSDSDDVNVPTFGCIVYVSKVDGGVSARVANLPDLKFAGSSERDALSKLVPAFKESVRASMMAGQEIAWIDPPLPIEDHEQKRFVPVHL